MQDKQPVSSNEIQKALLILVKCAGEVVLPNYYYGQYECDVFRITQSDYTIEYEIKISRSDYLADFKKDGGKKHLSLKVGDEFKAPNRFFFVVPEGLITVDELPSYAGLIYYYGKNNISIVKAGKLIHKKKFINYRMIARSFGRRDEAHRAKISFLSRTNFYKEMSEMKKNVENMINQNSELRNENYLYECGGVKDINDKWIMPEGVRHL